MRELAHTFVITLGVVVVLVVSIFSMNSCSERNASLKDACIRSGGVLIDEASGNFHCIQQNRNQAATGDR